VLTEYKALAVFNQTSSVAMAVALTMWARHHISLAGTSREGLLKTG
jgi:hypothetical protein